jgi:tRNA A-37 threonylcarbamoyl transferase component Bud32
MTDSPREARPADEETIDQQKIASGSTEVRTAGEALTQAPAGGPADEADVSTRVRIPGYEVLGLLGKGGMGVVYKARQTALDRIVALKMILHAEHAGSAERQRFQAEAEAAARLQHPNIVQVFEVGTHDGLPFLTLEYCPGGSLAQRLDGTPWPIREAAHLVETLAGAAQAAHAARVVHRDLNPANVLLTTTGQPKIADFGVAKKLGEHGRTQTGTMMGTPSYMAPEQASGKAKEAGPAADIYALGAIFYALLTGRPPFQAATPLDTILQVAANEPVPVRRLRPQVPRDLETICHKCLEKDPAKRYASAESLAADLRHFLAGEPIRARPVSRWERGWKWAKRRPAAAVATAASAIALLCLFVLMAVLWRTGGQPVAPPSPGPPPGGEPDNVPIMPLAPGQHEAKAPAEKSKQAPLNIWQRLQMATGIEPVTQPKQPAPPAETTRKPSP